MKKNREGFRKSIYAAGERKYHEGHRETQNRQAETGRDREHGESFFSFPMVLSCSENESAETGIGICAEKVQAHRERRLRSHGTPTTSTQA